MGEVASTIALKEKVKWLLHIDADEMFYAPGYADITQHFRLLSEQGFDQAVYLNYEGVPISLQATPDYFRHINQFKRNQIMLNTDVRAYIIEYRMT